MNKRGNNGIKPLFLRRVCNRGRRLIPKVVTQHKERPIGVDCRRCDGRREGPRGRVRFFFVPLPLASRTPHRLHESRNYIDHAPLGPISRSSESEPPPFSALSVSYKSGEGTLPPPTLPNLLIYPFPLAVPSFTGNSFMLVPSQGSVDAPADSLAHYSQSLRDYTLRLWVESRRQADERVNGRSHNKSHGTAKMPLSTSSRKPSDDGNSSGNSSTGTSSGSLTSPTYGPHA
ncbi:hypothetical protein EDB84DRAFT_109767 [Lactarius hengduanensis]|nr:hypothetical protein EDB84DRAFT_109767 [Lactarius hengduanensis]